MSRRPRRSTVPCHTASPRSSLARGVASSARRGTTARSPSKLNNNVRQSPPLGMAAQARLSTSNV